MTGTMDLRRILELTDRLYGAAEASTQWDHFLKGLAELLGGRGFGLYRIDPERPGLDRLDCPPDMAEAAAGWFEEMARTRLDPPAVIEHDRGLAAVLRRVDGVPTIVGLMRGHDDKPFRAEDGEVFALLVPLMARALRFQKFFAAKTPLIKLPPRQREVLTLGAQGLRSKEIAEKLGLSARTVEHHFTEAAKRLNARGRSQAIATALDLGLIAPDGGPNTAATGKK